MSRYLRSSDLRRLLGVSCSGLQDLYDQGLMPGPEETTTSGPRWHESTIRAWLESGRPRVGPPRRRAPLDGSSPTPPPPPPAPAPAVDRYAYQSQEDRMPHHGTSAYRDDHTFTKAMELVGRRDEILKLRAEGYTIPDAMADAKMRLPAQSFSDWVQEVRQQWRKHPTHANMTEDDMANELTPEEFHSGAVEQFMSAHPDQFAANGLESAPARAARGVERFLALSPAERAKYCQARRT